MNKARSHLSGCGLIKVGDRDAGAFLGQPDGTGPADTVPSTGDYHCSAGKAPELSLLHGWSLPRSWQRRFSRPEHQTANRRDRSSWGSSTH